MIASHRPFKRACLPLILLALSAAAPARSVAVFDFELDDTSLQGSVQGRNADEQARLTALRGQLVDLLGASGEYASVPLGADAQKARDANLRECGDCDLTFAKEAGARIAAVGWVQKVSNLILNINVRMRDVDSGEVVAAGSVDIRGNTDESWTRGLRYLVKNRLLSPPPP